MTESWSAVRNPRRTVTLERTYDASIQDVWEMWTTREGIESWWGPDGFAVTVQKLDLRPGGELLYTMGAVATEMVAFMKDSGMPVAHEARATFTQIDPPRRLVYTHVVDFIPGLEERYDVVHTVELSETGGGVRMVLSFEAMHADEWTDRAVAGWEMELNKLERQLATR